MPTLYISIWKLKLLILYIPSLKSELIILPVTTQHQNREHGSCLHWKLWRNQYITMTFPISGNQHFFEGTHFSPKQCSRLKGQNFHKNSDALLSIKAHAETWITVFFTGIHSGSREMLGAKVCFNRRPRAVCVCGQCTSLMAELTLTGLICLYTAVPLIIK